MSSLAMCIAQWGKFIIRDWGGGEYDAFSWISNRHCKISSGGKKKEKFFIGPELREKIVWKTILMKWNWKTKPNNVNVEGIIIERDQLK